MVGGVATDGGCYCGELRGGEKLPPCNCGGLDTISPTRMYTYPTCGDDAMDCMQVSIIILTIRREKVTGFKAYIHGCKFYIILFPALRLAVQDMMVGFKFPCIVYYDNIFMVHDNFIY